MVAPSPGSSDAGPIHGSAPQGGQLGDRTGMPGHRAMVEPAHAQPALAADPLPRSGILSDLLELTKPRIVTMILITAVVAALIAAGSAVSLGMLVHLLIGTALVAGSAGAMNQVWEFRVDALMERTRRRPIPAGRLGLPLSACFGMAIGVLGTAYLYAAFGPIPALVAVATWLLYVPIYTPLKVRSEWNTTVGALSGALPIMIGYTAAGGSLGDVSGWLLVGVLFAWQYPHFMAIAWLCRRQYDEAGFQMTTTLEPTGRRAGWQSVAGMAMLTLCLIALAVILTSGAWLATAALIGFLLLATYPMTAAAVRFALRRDDLTARRLLRASLLQLPGSLMLLTIAALIFGS